MGVESQHKGNEQVVGIPKGLEGLLADATVRGGIHEHHAQEHDMACDPARFGEVYLDGLLTAQTVCLDVVEASPR